MIGWWAILTCRAVADSGVIPAMRNPLTSDVACMRAGRTSPVPSAYLCVCIFYYTRSVVALLIYSFASRHVTNRKYIGWAWQFVVDVVKVHCVVFGSNS